MSDELFHNGLRRIRLQRPQPPVPRRVAEDSPDARRRAATPFPHATPQSAASDSMAAPSGRTGAPAAPTPHPRPTDGRAPERLFWPPTPRLGYAHPAAPFGLGLLNVPMLPEPAVEPAASAAAHFGADVEAADRGRPARRRRLSGGRSQGLQAEAMPRRPWPSPPGGGQGWSPEALRVAFENVFVLSNESVPLSEQIERERRQEAWELRRRPDAHTPEPRHEAQEPHDERAHGDLLPMPSRPYRPWEDDAPNSNGR